MITPFQLGSRIMIQSWAGSGYGTIAKIGRKYITISLEGGGAVQLHPTMIIRDSRLSRLVK